jgi:hypothetical protein
MSLGFNEDDAFFELRKFDGQKIRSSTARWCRWFRWCRDGGAAAAVMAPPQPDR